MRKNVTISLPILLVNKLKSHAEEFSISSDKLIHDAIDEYLINHKDIQYIKDIEDLIFEDDELTGTNTMSQK
ncbi:hypothetical protein LGK95_01305 [Clostridium algoriphilum]|uniref:hypothetical protein n=1 Tax=Clostridium algoriphilum TaxID=198347 RepID=UPI001CF111E4|nr:hypothetical protein [Clostridium algoriphilum]MCB2292173.1 hypothetical protein [Clostridium algoriphilum]